MELGDIGQTIIFMKTKVSENKVHKALAKTGYEVTSVHGSMSEVDRDKIVKEFKDCLTQVLIATDVIARGFDQHRVMNMVVIYNPTKYETGEPDYEVYLHRVGRVGRFGRKDDGWDKQVMEKIEKYFEGNIERILNLVTLTRIQCSLSGGGIIRRKDAIILTKK